MEIKKVLHDYINKIETKKHQIMKHQTTDTKKSELSDSVELSDFAKVYAEASKYAQVVDTFESIDLQNLEEVKGKLASGYYKTHEDDIIESILKDLIEKVED